MLQIWFFWNTEKKEMLKKIRESGLGDFFYLGSIWFFRQNKAVLEEYRDMQAQMHENTVWKI